MKGKHQRNSAWENGSLSAFSIQRSERGCPTSFRAYFTDAVAGEARQGE